MSSTPSDAHLLHDRFVFQLFFSSFWNKILYDFEPFLASKFPRFPTQVAFNREHKSHGSPVPFQLRKQYRVRTAAEFLSSALSLLGAVVCFVFVILLILSRARGLAHFKHFILSDVKRNYYDINSLPGEHIKNRVDSRAESSSCHTQSKEKRNLIVKRDRAHVHTSRLRS